MLVDSILALVEIIASSPGSWGFVFIYHALCTAGAVGLLGISVRAMNSANEFKQKRVQKG